MEPREYKVGYVADGVSESSSGVLTAIPPYWYCRWMCDGAMNGRRFDTREEAEAMRARCMARDAEYLAAEAAFKA